MIFRVDFKTAVAEESRLLSWGSFLLLLLVLDLCYALGEGGTTTITDGRKISEGVCPPYIHHVRSNQEKTRQTDSQPVMNNNDIT